MAKKTNNPVTIKIKKNSKMKTIDLKYDAIQNIRQMIVNLCDKSFYDGGCVNDADLDEIEDKIWKIVR